MKNRVKKYRQAMKLSQKRLAELVGTSQQQIQRLEAGSSPVRLDIGANISKALQKPLNVLFPGSEKALNKVAEERKSSCYVELDAWDEVRDSGLEPDPRVWTVEIALRGYPKPLLFLDVPAQDKARLLQLIQNEEDSDTDVAPFVVFDSAERRVAINLRELSCCHVRFDQPDHIPLIDEKTEADEDIYGRDAAWVYLVGQGEPLPINLDIDEQFEDGDDEMGICSGALFDLQAHCPNARRIHLTDVNGESIFIRAGNIVALVIPLYVLEPPDMDGID